MNVDRRGGGRLHGVASGLVGIALLLAFAVAYGAATTSNAGAAGNGRVKLPGHQGLVPPGATLVGPAPTATALPLTVTLKPRDPAALAAEVQAVSDPGSPEYHHFLTPDGIRAGIRADARHHRAGHGQPPTAGSDGRDAIGHGSVPARVGHGGPGAVRLLDADLAVPPVLGQDRLRQRDGSRSGQPRWRPRSKASSASTPSALRSRRRASRRRARPVAHPAEDLAAPALAPGQPSPTRELLHQQHQLGVRHSTGALDAPELAQAYAFDPLYSSNDYGAGSTVALLEMAGAGYSPSDINTFASCYGITLGTGQITQTNIDGGGATGQRHSRGRARHRDGALPGTPGQHRGLRGWLLGQPLQRLQQDRQRRHGQDRQRQLDERLRGLCRPIVAELGEHALPGGGRGRAVDLRRLGRPGRAGLQHQRRDRCDDGLQSGGAGGRPLDRHPLHRQQVEQHASAWTARGARAARPTSPPRSRCHGRARDPMPSRSTQPPARSSWPTPNSSLTVVSTATCNQTTTTGCAHRRRSPRVAT